MLGEAAITYEDAEVYFQNYKNAINVIGSIIAITNIVFQLNFLLYILVMKEIN